MPHQEIDVAIEIGRRNYGRLVVRPQTRYRMSICRLAIARPITDKNYGHVVARL